MKTKHSSLTALLVALPFVAFLDTSCKTTARTEPAPPPAEQRAGAPLTPPPAR